MPIDPSRALAWREENIDNKPATSRKPVMRSFMQPGPEIRSATSVLAQSGHFFLLLATRVIARNIILYKDAMPSSVDDDNIYQLQHTTPVYNTECNANMPRERA